MATAGQELCCSILYTTETTPAALVNFHYLTDRDLLFAHVQTSAGLLLCFMTISVGLPCHQGLWPQSLILSCVSKFQTLAESFQFHRRTPKCCHSPFPDHLALWVRDTSGDLWERARDHLMTCGSREWEPNFTLTEWSQAQCKWHTDILSELWNQSCYMPLLRLLLLLLRHLHFCLRSLLTFRFHAFLTRHFKNKKCLLLNSFTATCKLTCV